MIVRNSVDLSITLSSEKSSQMCTQYTISYNRYKVEEFTSLLLLVQNKQLFHPLFNKKTVEHCNDILRK